MKPALARFAVHVGGRPVNLQQVSDKTKEKYIDVPLVDMDVVLDGK